MDPYMARKPLYIEVVNDNKTNHFSYIITDYTYSIISTHILKTDHKKLIIKQLKYIYLFIYYIKACIILISNKTNNLTYEYGASCPA
jgi:hypothetical protein